MSSTHPNHITRYSDSSWYNEICINCGATDSYGSSGLNKLSLPCPGKPYKNIHDRCSHPGHEFPKYLYIPPGSSHTHKCHGCGQTTTITTPCVTL